MTALRVFKGGRSHDDLTVSQAREYMNDHMAAGTTCLVCGHLCKFHRRSLWSTLIGDLRTLARFEGDWVESSEAGFKNGDYAKLRYWDLVEKRGKKWRITALGRDFLAGKKSVPRTALVFQNECRGLEGDQVFVADIVGDEGGKGQ